MVVVVIFFLSSRSGFWGGWWWFNDLCSFGGGFGVASCGFWVAGGGLHFSCDLKF